MKHFSPILGRSIFSLLSVVCTAQGQLPSERFQRFTPDDGLSQSSVYCILQDRQGFMWFGTADGLNRFDGYSFTVFRHRAGDSTSLIDNTIRCLSEDPSGTLWVGTDKGLHRYDRRTERFARFYLRMPILGSTISLAVEEILADQQGLFLCGSLGLHIFDTSTGGIAHHLFDSSLIQSERNQIRCVLPYDAGRLLVGTLGGMVIYTPQSREAIPVSSKYPSWHLLDTAKAAVLWRFQDSILWIGTRGWGLFRANLRDGTIRDMAAAFRNAQLPTPRFISSLAHDSSGRLWVATSDQGLFRFSPTEGGMTRMNSNPDDPASVGSTNIPSLCVDRSGIVWIGTDGAGVRKLDTERKPFHHYYRDPANKHSLAGNFVKAVLEDRGGRLWVGTLENGLSCLDRATGKWLHFRNRPNDNRSLPGKSAQTLCEDNEGVLWVGTDAGLARFEEDKRRFTTFRIPSEPTAEHFVNSINSILPVGTDSLVVGTSLGVFWFFKSSRTFRSFVHDGANFDNHARLLFRDRSGAVWVGTYAGGVFRFDRSAGELVRFGAENARLSSVRSIFEDADGVFWFGTEEGLARFDPRSNEWYSYTTEDAHLRGRSRLPNDFLYGVLGDDQGHLWISTNKGLSRFDHASETFRNYGPDDGLQSNEFNTGAYFKCRHGEMFFGGINGLNAFFPDSIKDNPRAPLVALTGFKKFDLPADSDIKPSETRELEFRHDENIFSLEFAALEYTNPAKNTYAYIMEGFETEWTYCGTRREVRYTNLPAGDYTFRVKAANSDGVWNEQGLSIAIRIIPPFWSRWWFVVSVVLAGFVALGGAIRYVEMRKLRKKIERLEQERALERERARISKDMHDDVGANLTKIAIMSELALKDGAHEGTASHLHKISQTARDVVDNISEIIWAINPKNDKLENLAGYVREYVSEYLEGTGISCHFDFPDNVPRLSLSAEVRRNVFLVVKEAIHNVVKHSGASKLRLMLGYDGGRLSMRIVDNGIGFSSQDISRFGDGLGNMRKRIEEIGGICDIDSAPGHETRVTIDLAVRGDEF